MARRAKAKLQGTLRVPGDKSISHRAVLFSAFARGTCQVEELSSADDVRSSIACLSALGVKAVHDRKSGRLSLAAPGVGALACPGESLFAGNSGTTARLLSGILAGCPFTSSVDGDDSLRSRPMARVLKHLEAMGAKVDYQTRSGHLPLTIQGGHLCGQTFTLDVASAQVQTALVLAGLQASGKTTVVLPAPVRDHTERMMRTLHMPFSQPDKLVITVERLGEPVAPYKLRVPADISSAAFFMVAAALLPGSQVRLTEVVLNAGRALVCDVLKEMGAEIELVDTREVSGEPVADIIVKGGERLRGATISGDRIAAGIDEIPVLALAGALCDGELTVNDAQELRVKESDRLALIVTNLRAAGITVDERSGGFTVHGQSIFPGGSAWATHGDHRLAMTGLVANLVAEAALDVADPDCVSVSYPGFSADLQGLIS